MLTEFCIPAYNEEQIIRGSALKLLEYLKAGTLPFDWRIVIIVNGSSDSTGRIAEELAAENPEIKRENRFDKRKSRLGVLCNSWEFLKNLFWLRRRLRGGL